MTVAGSEQARPQEHRFLPDQAPDLPVLHGFIHYKDSHDDDVAPSMTSLKRWVSAPPPGCEDHSFTPGSTFYGEDNASEDTSCDSEYEEECETPANLDHENEVASRSFQAISSCQIAGRQLKGKDCRLSKNFTFPSPADPTKVFGLTMTLTPLGTSKKRGGSSFAAAKGKASVDIKCGSNAVDVEFEVCLGVPGRQPVRVVVHNFARDAVCKLADDVEFLSLVDAATDCLDLNVTLTALGKIVDTTSQPSELSDSHSDEIDDASLWQNCPASLPFNPYNCYPAGACIQVPVSQAISQADYTNIPAQDDMPWEQKGTTRMVNHSVREGDWYCLGCGDFQFARNDRCRLCKTPKPKNSERTLHQQKLQQQPQMFTPIPVMCAVVPCMQMDQPASAGCGPFIIVSRPAEFQKAPGMTVNKASSTSMDLASMNSGMQGGCQSDL